MRQVRRMRPLPTRAALPQRLSPSVSPSSAGDLDDVDPGRLHRRHLLRRRALAAGDDGAGVAHAASRRRGAAGDEADDRLLEVGLDALGRVLLGVAADLADHDDGLGLGVVVEQLQHVDEVGAVDRVAADADAGRLAEPEVR